MKVLLIIICLLVSISRGHAQTYDEWVRQKKTQKKYLLQQIAALQVYIGYGEKGYSIVTKGLNAIQNIKRGDFNLHSGYFSSLSKVNPRIQQYSQVAGIIAMQVSIGKQVRNTLRDCRKANQLTGAELKYLQQVFNNLLDDCAKDLDELQSLISGGELQMKDDERIKRIDKLYSDSQEKQVFVQSFGASAKGLSVQRLNDGYDTEIERKLNGVK